MAAITAGGRQHRERVEWMKIMGGNTGFGGGPRRPDKDPQDEDKSLLKRCEHWLEHFYHSLYCWWINVWYPHPKKDSPQKPPTR